MCIALTGEPSLVFMIELMMGLVCRKRVSCVVDRSDWPMILTYVSAKTNMGTPIFIWLFFIIIFHLVKEEQRKSLETNAKRRDRSSEQINQSPHRANDIARW